VHRDFKPANVLLGPDGPRVVDFGIARLVDAGTVTTGVIGTPSFMAPEQLAGARPGSAVDIFAWAVTMVFAATGRSPFGSGAVQAVMWRIMSEEPDLGGVPPPLLPVVRQCLDKDPSRRPVARDLLLRLVDPSAQYPHPPASPAAPGYPAYPADMPAATGPAPATVGPTFPSDLPAGPTGPGRTSGRSRRGPILAVGAAAVVAALVIGGVLLLTRPSSPRHAAAGSSGAGHTTSPGTLHSLTPTPATQVVGLGIPAAFAGTWTGVASLVSPVLDKEPHQLHPRGRRADRARGQPGVRQRPGPQQGDRHRAHLQRAADAVLPGGHGDVHPQGCATGLQLAGCQQPGPEYCHPAQGCVSHLMLGHDGSNAVVGRSTAVAPLGGR